MKKLLLILILTVALYARCTLEKEHPPIVVTFPVTEITINSAISGGYISDNGGSDIISRGVVWSTSSNPTLDSYSGIITNENGAGEFISQLSELEPGVIYYVRAYATNHSGTGYGPFVTFRTGDGQIQISTYINDISGFSITATCAIESDGGDCITDRGLVWIRKNQYTDPTIHTHDGIISGGGGNTSFSANIAGLSAYTEYHILAYAINSMDTFYANLVTVRTIVSPDGVSGTVTDIDGNEYSTITIGGIEWMTENLRTTRFNNGTPIPNVTSNQGWNHLDSPAWSWYDNDETQYGQYYGVLYNRHAVLTDKLCPAGWHVPGFTELHHHLTWYLLYEYGISNYQSETYRLFGNVLKSCRQENSPLGGDCETVEHPRWNANQTHYGNDLFGFSALPGGYRIANGNFSHIGLQGRWWTKEGYSQGKAFVLQSGNGQFEIIDQPGSTGLSVRCVREVTE